MKFGIIGGGFTGLAAAFELLKKGHSVSLIERESFWGGLAGSYEVYPQVFVERFYHHLFTNDEEIIGLCRELKIEDKLVAKEGKTAILHEDKVYPFDSPLSLLRFSPLKIVDRVRFGLATLYLKMIKNGQKFEGQKAFEWVERVYGQAAFRAIWKPLLTGKFDGYVEDISLVWFWARVYKRTPQLIYPSGGYQTIVEALTLRIDELGGRLSSGTKIRKISQTNKGWEVEADGYAETFDKIICTTSLRVFSELFLQLPEDYRRRIDTINYINAQTLILVLSEPFNPYYWINICDPNYPFLVLVEHTNLVDREIFQGKTVLYLGNYLPDDDPRLNMDGGELLDLFEPYLKRINRNFLRSQVERAVSFVGRSAQPIVNSQYRGHIPGFRTPLENLYLATMAQVYPWDRGTNYAVKLAQDLVRECF